MALESIGGDWAALKRFGFNTNFNHAEVVGIRPLTTQFCVLCNRHKFKKGDSWKDQLGQQSWETPEWFGTWSIATGILKLVLSGLALFACIRLLQAKSNSVKLFYWSAGLNIGLVALKGAVTIAFMAMAMMFGGFFGLVVNVVLLLVVVLGNKEAFSLKPPSTA